MIKFYLALLVLGLSGCKKALHVEKNYCGKVSDVNPNKRQNTKEIP